MLLTRWSQKFYQSTRGRIVGLLRQATLTVDQIATALGLTDNAVRSHLTSLERDGLVEQSLSKRGGVGKPAYEYRIAADAEPLFSQAYLPILVHLLEVLRDRLPPAELERVMNDVGTRMAAGQTVTPGELEKRVQGAAALLDALGGITEVARTDAGALAIRGFSCPLGAAVRGHPEVCSAVEVMLSDVIGAPVRECCERGDRPRCCFEVDAKSS
jgi:predicted ArsR family transcriptional regulator